MIGSYVDLLDRVDAEDRVSRKRIERMKEGMEARLEALKARKDDLLTIAEIGVDQVIVDEMQEFRKLTFTTNQSTLKGVDPDGSQRAWDLYVKARFLGSKRAPMRALIAASGTPITNTLGEMFTIQRFFQPEMLAERGIQEFDAWAAAFGETTTDLELQPSGLYKPVTRFAEFVNIPELIAMFRDFADVVLQSELRQKSQAPEDRRRPAPDRRRSREPRLQGLPEGSGSTDQGRSNSASANPRRATTSCSRSSPTAAMPRSTSGSSTPSNRTSPRTS